MAKLSATFGPQHCQFKVDKAKQSTARCVVQSLGVPHSVTIESSFCGANGQQFSSRDYRGIGAALVAALKRDSCDPRAPPPVDFALAASDDAGDADAGSDSDPEGDALEAPTLREILGQSE